jgi:hypothetical protein
VNIEAPAALWLALTLPVILALWLLRPRRVRQRVSSLFLWRTSLAERKSAEPWQRLRNDPLLWLQLLVALLVIGAALRPFLPAQVEARHTVILLDASGSMRATDLSPDRFAAAREQVARIARALSRDQRVTLIRVDQAPDLLATAAPGKASAIEQALAGAEPGYGAGDLTAAFALAEGMAPDATEWLLVTDGGLDVPAGTQLPEQVTLRQQQVALGRASGNVAVTGLRVRVEGERTSVQASVRNYGDAAVSGRLVLLAEADVAGARDLTIAPGAEQQLTWSRLPAGARWLEARLADVPQQANALAHDDRAWAALPAQTERRVLLVSDGNTFLERMLAVLTGVRAGRVGRTNWKAVSADAPYDIVILDGFWPDQPPASNMLIVGPQASTSFSPERIQAASHPLVRYVDWSDVNIARAAQLPFLAGWETVVRSAGQPLLAVREQAGRRDVVFTFRLDNSDLALRPAFPVLMANLIDWLAPRSAGAALAVSPGDALRIEPAPLADTIVVLDAAGAIDSLAPPWPAGIFRPPAPGLYRVIQKGPSVRHEQLLVASGYTASEANLSPRPLALTGANVESGRGIRLAAWSIWPLLALLVITIALVEWWVDARGR